MLSVVIHGLLRALSLALLLRLAHRGAGLSPPGQSPQPESPPGRQDITLLLLWLSEQFAEHIPVNHKPREEDTQRCKGCARVGAGRGCGEPSQLGTKEGWDNSGVVVSGGVTRALPVEAGGDGGVGLAAFSLEDDLG